MALVGHMRGGLSQVVTVFSMFFSEMSGSTPRTFTIYFPSVVLWLPKQVIPESVGCFKSPSGGGYICPK
jgi:TRAP-type C4-dicarboxylate transport system permease large subunit